MFDSRLRLRNALVPALGIVLSLAATGTVRAATAYYTPAQAGAGATVYSASCQQCHGVNLQGQSAPALTGATFRNYVGKSGTAQSLFDFISRQMPADHPGSLTQQEYLNVTAFLLSRNGYPAGRDPLTKSTLPQVQLGNANVSTGAKGGRNTTSAVTKGATSAEIMRAAPPQNTVLWELPAGADVNVTDAMLLQRRGRRRRTGCSTGRTYDNARYSPLTRSTTGTSARLRWRASRRPA